MRSDKNRHQMTAHAARFILVMGVSGVGKSTVARSLSDTFGGTFLEGDAFHPPANVAHMAAGHPLTDEMREPWLSAIAQEAQRLATIATGTGENPSVFIACSALKIRYRRLLAAQLPRLTILHLTGARELIAERMAQRTDHFMPPSLLESQLSELEPPDDDEAIAIDVASSRAIVLAEAISRLRPMFA